MEPTQPSRSTTRTVRRSTLALLVFWLVVFAALWAGFRWHELRENASLQAYVNAGGTLVIPRSRDGHFYAEGEVNHQPVRFLVDTGATSVAVTEGTARAARLPAGQRIMMSTAGGMREGRLVRGVPVRVGPLVHNDTTVSVGITSGDPDSALLGQSFLRHFDVRITADQMELRAD